MRGKLYIVIITLFVFCSLPLMISAQNISDDILKERKKAVEESRDFVKDDGFDLGLTVDPNKTARELVEELLGDGFFYDVNVFNAEKIGIANSNGFFFSNNSNIGMPSGIIFSSGDANDAEGENDSSNIGASDPVDDPGDTDLDNLPDMTKTSDASGIEFDFIPETDTIKFQYVFGSDEYPEYNDGLFNDVFAFFLSGEDPNGGVYIKKNIALIPNTETPITIRNVNSEDNSEYYINNNFQGTGTVEYDGFTVELTAWALVVPCTEYHIKIVIADELDWAWDSGVFLKSNSFTAATVEVVPVYTHESIPGAVEGCNDVTLNFDIDARDLPTEIYFNILQEEDLPGQAEYGVDYTTNPALPDFPVGMLTIPPMGTSITLEVIPLEDGIVEAPEFFNLLYTHDMGCNGSSTDTVTLVLEDHLAVNIQPFGDIELSCGDTTVLSVEVTDGYPEYGYSWSSGLGTLDSIVVSPRDNKSYTISVNDECGFNNEYTFDVLVEQPVAVISGNMEICAFEAIDLVGSGGTTYLWGNNSTNDTHSIKCRY